MVSREMRSERRRGKRGWRNGKQEERGRGGETRELKRRRIIVLSMGTHVPRVYNEQEKYREG